LLQLPFCCDSQLMHDMAPNVIKQRQLKLAPLLVRGAAIDTRSDTEPFIRLFAGLTKEDIAEIMASGVVRRFGVGRIIVRASEPGMRLYLVKTGSVNYYRVTSEGWQILITRFSPGETFGLGTLLAKPVAYLGTAETVRETELCVWEHSWIRRFVEKHPLLAENALQIGLEYIKLYSDRHAALVSKSAEGRLARMLALVGVRVGRRSASGVEVQITNEHLASLADIGKFTASRLLKKWARKGTVEKTRGKVIIRCPEKMFGSLPR